MENHCPYFAYYSHHKCATKFVLAIVSRICVDAGWDLLRVDRVDEYVDRLDIYSQQRRADAVAHINAEYEQIEGLRCKGFHVIRDPRDVLVSGYFSHLKSHSDSDWPELSKHREILKTLPKEEGLRAEFEFSRPYLEAMGRWRYDDERIYETTFEQLTANPYEVLMSIASFLEILPPNDMPTIRSRVDSALRSIVNRVHRRRPRLMPFRLKSSHIRGADLLAATYANRFESKAGGRKAGDTDEGSHYRKGVPGDWRNHFTENINKRFNDEYGYVLRNTGYPIVHTLAAATSQAASP